MGTHYFEDLAQFERREAERRMLFAALRRRRARLSARGVFTSMMWLLGVKR